MAEAILNRCAHPQCTCPVSEDEEFCSPACLDAAEEGSTNEPCGCSHPQCASAKAA